MTKLWVKKTKVNQNLEIEKLKAGKIKVKLNAVLREMPISIQILSLVRNEKQLTRRIKILNSR